MTNMYYSIPDVVHGIGAASSVSGNQSLRVRRIAPLHEADGDCCTWVRSEHANKQELVDRSRAAILICDTTVGRSPGEGSEYP